MKKFAQFFRFARVSLLATAVDFGAGYGLIQTGLSTLVWATVLGSFAGIVVGFVLNKFWVFKADDSTQTATQFIKYVVTSLGNTILNTLAVWLLENAGLENYWLIRVIAGTVVFVGYSYVVNKLFVFADHEKAPESAVS